jgi:hypothetical protein
MIIAHRNKAILGLAGWLLPLIALLSSAIFRNQITLSDWIPEHLFLALGWGTVLFEMFCFFWAGYHLAKGKGYSSALVCFGFFPCLQPVVLTALLALPDKNPVKKNRPESRPSNRPPESTTARMVRYRRNALLGNVFGLFFVMTGISIIYFPLGLCEDFEDETLLGFLIFVCGYVGVLWGCRWWLKARGWPEALIFIGLMPLVICLIPFVRQVFFVVPDLLPLSLLLMTLILLVVVATLPNRSKLSRRNQRGDFKRPGIGT